MPRYPKVCVIGAGSSGIAAAKALKDRGIPFDCFEKSDQVGGNWVFQNKNAVSACYKSLHINTSVARMQYSAFPIPEGTPDFPHHTVLAQYFSDYTDHFDLRRHITFETEVSRCEPLPEGRWRIILGTGESRTYEAIVVANGHHWDPRWPEPPIPGEFHGLQLHSHGYVDQKPFEDRKVVVVGCGNSAMDIAVELSRWSSEVHLSIRRSAWVLPKYWFGRPLDQIPQHPLIPFSIRQAMFRLLYWIAMGNPERYGIPRPDHVLGDAHPTVSAEFPTRVASGDIGIKPMIKRLSGSAVQFQDGTEVEADAIIYCTGYKISFPFFKDSLIAAVDNETGLYYHVFHPDQPTVFFVGLCQPLGAIMPIAEQQSRWIAEYLAGDYALPDRERMKARIQHERAKTAKRYVTSKRHTIQVDFDDYLFWLRWERWLGRRRTKSSNAWPLTM